MLLKGEKEKIIETKRRGREPAKVKVVETTPALFASYLHNMILEAKREGKRLEVRTN